MSEKEQLNDLDKELLDLEVSSTKNEDEEEEHDDFLDDEDEPKKKEKPKYGKKNEHYVNPKELDALIIKFYDDGIMTNELGTSVEKIAVRLSFSPNFINYTYKEDMVGDAKIKMFKALENKKYNHIKGLNPFSYFTKIAYNAFRNRIKREKKAREALVSYQESVYETLNETGYFHNKHYSNDDYDDNYDE